MANIGKSLFYLEHFYFVVLLIIGQRKCLAQSVGATFHCSTLQPTIPEVTLQMGEESSGQFSITVDQPYYQQGSVRRVTVSGDPFSYLYLQARIEGGGVIGGWTSPLPNGYTFTPCGGGQAILKTDDSFQTSAVFEWSTPFTDTSVDVIFMVTFVSSVLYYIISSTPIIDPCIPNPCQAGNVCFRGTTAPGYICAGCDAQFCLNGGMCIINQGGSAQCLCPASFMGTQCQFPREQSACSSGPCFNMGTCVPLSTGYSCTCPSDYIGNRCELATFCSDQPCRNGGTCVLFSGTAGSCTCAPGFIGPKCDDQDPCFSFCQNGGTCTSSGTLATCQCATGFFGVRCEVPNGPCSQNPCFNGGVCSADATATGGFRCDCTNGYVGLFCQTVNPCNANPCQNFGTCLVDHATGEYFCNCRNPDLYMGENCEIVSPCVSNPCQNGGRCSQSDVGYECTCQGPYVGDNCESLDVCQASTPCANGAICFYLSHNSYYCHCPSGYSGSNCETQDPPSMTPCSPNPCTNGGMCTVDGGFFQCECPSHTLGPTCNIDFCAAFKPCFNGGTCRVSSDPDQQFSCTCVDRFRGDTCLIDPNKEPVFDNCPDGEIAFLITSGVTANITLVPIARVPETNELIEQIDIIVGPTAIDFPGELEYRDSYFEGVPVTLRATDEFNRAGTCSFTIKLIDQVPPMITCPEDHQDISSGDRVAVASLPLPFINATDNIGLREDSPIEFSPPMIPIDGQQRRITVTAYDQTGNKMECLFMLRIDQTDNACPEIDRTNGRVSCSVDGSRTTQACRLTCDYTYAAINGEYYTCSKGTWDKEPLPCVAMQIPRSLSKVIRFIYPLSGPCSEGNFLIDAQEAMLNKLEPRDLCVLGRAMTCTPDSIKAVCLTLGGLGEESQRQKRQTSEAVVIDVTVFGDVDTDSEEIKTDIDNLISMLKEAGLELNLRGNNVAYTSATSLPRFSSTCYEGSISKDGNCLICPTGTMHAVNTNECNPCKAGHYQDEEGQTSCTMCEPQTFQNTTGATSCLPCLTSNSVGEVECPQDPESPIDWVMIIIYACVGVGALLIIIIFVLMVCLWRSTQEEKRQDLKRWELGQLNQHNKSFEPEEETGFRQRMNTTVSASTYQTVPEGDGTPNLGNGYTSGLVPIPIDELYAGFTLDSQGNTLMVGVDTHQSFEAGEHQGYNRYQQDSGPHSPSNGFMTSSHNRHNFNV